MMNKQDKCAFCGHSEGYHYYGDSCIHWHTTIVDGHIYRAECNCRGWADEKDGCKRAQDIRNSVKMLRGEKGMFSGQLQEHIENVIAAANMYAMELENPFTYIDQ